ncbi:MAG: 3-hydroxyacyl-CoA dehydrogenase/enoyl-CoA hydratase family protein [Flavobacteriaceae bacterium]|nr:3-hydroxyacyl-CoA dehydrogenase/enoyl-CoA hydratase family protein [Flavobacteriaceae bacterium]
MKYKFKTVAVLGSGVMGAGIACHLANIGMKVIMLDIVPLKLSDKNKKNKNLRNSVVNTALINAIKSKPAALYKKDFSNRIETGNFEDDFHKISDADWIIEVVIERLDIKKRIYEKVEKFRKKGSVVTSNTSSIPIEMLIEGRSEDFKKHFCGTHFFNPPRYLRLLEIIPHKKSDKEMIEHFMLFGDLFLGKQTVLCKDTPAFIANRLGVMSSMKLLELTEEMEFKIEEVDVLTGSILGRPNTGTFRLQDLVGIDTGENVSKFVRSSVKGDEFIDSFKDIPTPKYIDFLVSNKFFGNKSKKGFYEKTDKKDEKGKTIINALNLKTLKYELSVKPSLDIIKKAKAIELFDKRINMLLEGNGRVNVFMQKYFSSLLAYSANRVPEISDQFFFVDNAMRSGYMWDYGPFEYWDLIGFEKGISLIESNGQKLPKWINEMQKKKINKFYKTQDGKRKYLDVNTFKYIEIPSADQFIILDSIRSNSPVIKNSECVVHDIGDGVLCVEFTSKSNSIGDGVGNGIHKALTIAEDEGWKGIVIGNNAKQFSVGANLMDIGMLAMQKQFKPLLEKVEGFQTLNMQIRTSKIPVVVATQGYVFGGGCEIAMHCDSGIYAAESYIGLVEVGVGLLPGGGGTKELVLRASDKFYEGDVKIPTLIDHFKAIATASVSTSAWEAFDYNYLIKGRDIVCTNTNRNIAMAKSKVLELSKNYIPPSQRDNIEVLGRGALGTLYTAINEFKLAGYMSDYDVEIAKKVAYVMAGGDLTSPQQVSEQYLLDLEREGFLSLLGNQKTLDRIQYLLMNNKPLRN